MRRYFVETSVIVKFRTIATYNAKHFERVKDLKVLGLET